MQPNPENLLLGAVFPGLGWLFVKQLGCYSIISSWMAL